MEMEIDVRMPLDPPNLALPGPKHVEKKVKEFAEDLATERRAQLQELCCHHLYQLWQSRQINTLQYGTRHGYGSDALTVAEMSMGNSHTQTQTVRYTFHYLSLLHHLHFKNIDSGNVSSGNSIDSSSMNSNNEVKITKSSSGSILVQKTQNESIRSS